MSYTNGLDKPTDYFNTVIYTGTGATQSITVGFQPDLVWGKSRSGSGYHHNLVDSVRGNTKYLESDRANAENTLTDAVTSFTSDGFTLGADAGDREFNENNNSMVAWNWLASNTTASNTDGSITSTVSANTTSGFSIVSYTGTGSTATVGHGLGTAPAMIIIKARSFSEEWLVYHQSMGNTDAINLNLTNAKSSSVNYWQNTTPSSSVVYIGANDKHNKSSETYIAYCFEEKKGFSKFGSYTGNGNADGTFVYTGFSPSFVMVKKTNGTGNWVMFDNKRNTFNVVNKRLVANLSDDEGTSDRLDFLSNGWKFRSTATNVNGSDSYIYMCFASSPFVTSTGIPTTAR